MWVLSHVWLIATPWTVACQAPLSEISQARILEWVAIFYARGSSPPRDPARVSCVSFTTGSPGKPISQSGKAGQRSLVCCSPRGNTESDMTEQLNNIRQNTLNCRFSLILWKSPLFRVLLAQGKIGPLIVTWFMGKKGEAKSNCTFSGSP